MVSDNVNGYGTEAPVDLTRAAAAALPADPRTQARQQASAPPGFDDLAVAVPSVTADPATWGWRGRVRRWTGGLIKPGPGPAEARHRQAQAAVRQHLGGTRLVMVANPRGGVGTSTTTLMLAHTFATLRGNPVVAWDNHEHHGTLAQRAEVATPATDVVQMLEAFPRLIGVTGTAGDLSHYLRAQPSRAAVLASNTDPLWPGQVGSGESGQVGLLLARHFPLAFMDTGHNIRAANWQWAAGAAHQLVVPVRLEPDAAQTAAWMLDALAQRRPDLVAGAVTVVGPASVPPPARLREQMLGYFAGRTAVVVEVPFDPQLAGGRPIVHARISDASRTAWTAAAAAVADRLAAAPAPRPDQIPRAAPPAQAEPPVPPEPTTARQPPGAAGQGRPDPASVVTPLRKAQGE